MKACGGDRYNSTLSETWQHMEGEQSPARPSHFPPGEGTPSMNWKEVGLAPESVWKFSRTKPLPQFSNPQPSHYTDRASLVPHKRACLGKWGRNWSGCKVNYMAVTLKLLADNGGQVLPSSSRRWYYAWNYKIKHITQAPILVRTYTHVHKMHVPYTVRKQQHSLTYAFQMVQGQLEISTHSVKYDCTCKAFQSKSTLYIT